MLTLGLLFDLALVALMVGVAWRLLAASDPFKAVTFFIAFGLLTAVAWARLGAPDLALAEAAIGAGVTGALFLAAVERLRPYAPPAPDGGAEADSDTAPDSVAEDRGAGDGA